MVSSVTPRCPGSMAAKQAQISTMLDSWYKMFVLICYFCDLQPNISTLALEKIVILDLCRMLFIEVVTLIDAFDLQSCKNLSHD